MHTMKGLVLAGQHAPFLTILVLQILSILFLISRIPSLLKNIICVGIMGIQVYLLLQMINTLRSMP